MVGAQSLLEGGVQVGIEWLGDVAAVVAVPVVEATERCCACLWKGALEDAVDVGDGSVPDSAADRFELELCCRMPGIQSCSNREAPSGDTLLSTESGSYAYDAMRASQAVRKWCM